MNKKPTIAVVGATGLVGTTFLKILEERAFPFENLYLMASAKSAGKSIRFRGVEYVVEELGEDSFRKPIDIALFSAGAGISLKYAPIAAASGCIVVDNSSAWRMDPDVPLIVPEVNPEAVEKATKGIIANPNCSTIQAMLPIKALHDAYKVRRIVYATYQSVSGAGVKGLRDLEEGLKGNDICKAFPHPIAGNCIPHIDVFLDNGYTKEEMKMVNETRKILGDESIQITATTVRVPVRGSHSESINLEFERPFDLQDAKAKLAAMSGLVVLDDPATNTYPLARDAEGTDEVYVGRIRRDFSVESGLNLWCVADNIRKGAATNTVQIAELLIK
ncbi:MAG: aspartate-semialdehyde dehydrogenase [Bacillota bacterium]|nr:aspartate-semialdehyde dehydrogenase [Eubacteriales bacterium]MDD3536756.1 aspartate-semialdehyde dehydrogenase [Eubacteriales bacterium]MDD4285658.1 aspartate-semialdehyde dehydrogenase [Eubacteriales bacterium]MDI9492598.1 aspartate-semialdehyde dehydrogenase [Bacillota bacterium]NLV69377.1 aspartate-semialdehyde dehydrogenase [Clostridiales bacterium]